MQSGKPIAFASRSLTDAETRYAQIEKELLAVLFGLERFNQYTYGRQVQVESDHKPLESILKKPLSAAPPRLQRMLLRLQKYSFDLTYCPGKELIVADTLSRAYRQTNTSEMNMDSEIECYVHMIMSNIQIADTQLEAIKNGTKRDDKMTKLREMIQKGWPNDKHLVPFEIRNFWNCRDELSEMDGLVLKGEKIVIPDALQKEMLKELHKSHMGIEKTKQRARDIMYWPGMNAQIADTVSNCSTCQEYRKSNKKEPLLSTQPTAPWEMVGTDLFMWNNYNYVLIVDYCSRYFEVAKLENTRASTVITHTKSVFARHGIPREVRSDNGPQFSSKEYGQFAKTWGFKHTTSSPKYPQSNGLAERTVQTVKGILNKAKRDGKDPYLSILEYRNTPIDDIGSPAQILMSRRLRSTLPTTNIQLHPQVIKERNLKWKLVEKKNQQKKQYDRTAKELPNLTSGDKVRIRRQDLWEPAVVVRKSSTPRSYDVKTQDGTVYRRNRRHMLQTKEKLPEIYDTYEDTKKEVTELNDKMPLIINEPNQTQEIRTRSGCLIKKPAR